MMDDILVRETTMAALAQVIDLGEVRRQRALRSAACRATPMPMPAMQLPVAWVPVWFFMPMWVPAPMDAVVGGQARA